MVNQPTQELIDSGLPAVIHRRLGYRCVSAEECKQLMGFSLSGWVVPMNDLEGKPFTHNGKPFYRLKPDPGQLKGDDPPKYLSPKSGGCRPYFSPLLPMNALATTRDIDITEGEKKADCANYHGFPTIGLSGVDAWRDKRNCKPDEHSRPLPELQAINWKRRKVRLVFDSDVTTKDSVRRALVDLSKWLTDQGASVLIVLLPCEIDGSKNGVDDFIFRHGPEAYGRLRRIARPSGDGESFTWTPEPKESHHKALIAWTVFNHSYAYRPGFGLHRWAGTHWTLAPGKGEKSLNKPLHQWMDAMKWDKRSANLIGSIRAELMTRLEHYEWNLANATSFRNGTIRDDQFTDDHRRDDWLTFCFPFPRDSWAKCPRWHQFLEETLEADDLIRLLRAAIRWSILPKDPEKPFIYELVFDVIGPRRSGKGTLSEVLQAICGGKHGVGLIKSSSFSNANALQSLIGKRIAIDPDASGRVSDPGVFNAVASNELVEVKKLYENHDSARLGVVVWRFFNDTPGASGGGMEGMGRRIVTFRFEQSVTNPDGQLKSKLIEEAAGIFWWAWSMPEDEMNDALVHRGKVSAVLNASMDGALERDHVLRFSTIADQGKYKAADLYDRYRQWMIREGHQPASSTKFGREIKKLDWIKPTTTRVGIWYELTTPTRHQIAIHLGVAIEGSRDGGLNSSQNPSRHHYPPPQDHLQLKRPQREVAGVVSSSLKNPMREEKEMKREMHIEKKNWTSNRPHPPPHEHVAQAVPVFLDGKSGWRSPSGRIPKAGGITLIAPNGDSHYIDAKRVSLHPTPEKANSHQSHLPELTYGQEMHKGGEVSAR